MNRKKEPYNRHRIGERIQKRRQNLGLSQEALAEQMDRATKYCSDIERGCCGMSIETMLAFSKHLNMSLDYMMYGVGVEELKPDISLTMSEEEADTLYLEQMQMNQLLTQCNHREYAYAMRMMEVFVDAMRDEEKNDNENKKDRKNSRGF